MKITLKRHPFKFYLNLFFWILICLSLSLFLLKLGLKEFEKPIFGGILALALIVYIIITYVVNAPNIILNKKGLYRNNQFYAWENLSSHKLTGKKLFGVSQEECVTLTFKNSKTIHIFDNLYSNVAEMKLFIQEIIIEGKDEIELKSKPTHFNDVNQEAFISFKGNPIFCFRGLFIWMPFLFLLGYTIIRLRI